MFNRLDYLELKKLPKPYHKLYKDNQFLQNTLFTNHQMIFKKINLSKILKTIYQFTQNYINEHFIFTESLNEYMLRFIMDYFIYEMSELVIKNKLNHTIITLSPNDILLLIPNFELYKQIQIRKNNNLIILPTIIIDYINITKFNNEINDVSELIHILLFLK